MKRVLSLLVSSALISVVGCSSSASSELVGESAAEVIGGTPYGGHPAVLLLNVDGHSDAGNYDYFGTCTATLIAPDVVLTAAHCVEDYATNHEKGRVSNAQTPDRATLPNGTNVSSVDIHPAWATQQFINEGHDCAILKLERPLAGVTPIPVYRGTNTARDIKVGNPVKVIGYGNNSGAGNGSGSGTKRSLDSSIVQVYDGVIGAGRTGATSCQGDSGGGLLEVIEGREQVIGVTSFGAEHCVEEGFWTNVSKTCLDLVRKYVPDDGTTPPPDPTCTPACADRACGDDGCGGTCGTCAAGSTCNAAGACIQPPVDTCGETEPNNTSTDADKLCVAGRYVGATSGTDYDYVGFTVTAGRTYALKFDSASTNANFVLYKAGPTGYSQIGQGPGELSRQTPTGGSYVAIMWSTNGANATYALSITK